MAEVPHRVTTGVDVLDTLITGLIPGDNVVWVTDSAEILSFIEGAYLRHAVEDGRTCSYVTTKTSPDQLAKQLGPRIAIIDARPGKPLGDPISLEREMVDRAKVAPLHCTAVDNLSALASRWGPQKALSFFSRTCPQLFNLQAVAYWRIYRDQPGTLLLEAVRRITQCVIEIVDNHLRIVKAEGRPQVVQGETVRFHLVDGAMAVAPECALGRLSRGLLQLRKSHNLTQAALARVAEVTPSAISQAETGRRGLSLDTLLLISDRLQISLDHLLPSTSALGYVIVRHDSLKQHAAGETGLLDSPSVGLRAALIRLGPGQAGVPPWPHAGVELVLVTEGLVQLELGEDTPVVRGGDVVLSTSAPIVGWRNLLSRPANLFWILRDP